MTCGGNFGQICGGPNALSVFNNTALILPTSSTVIVSSTTTTSGAPTSTTRPNIKYLGCANEGATGRALSKDTYTSNSMTPESCQDYCTSKGWQLSGTEYSTECWCGSVLENGATIGGSTACTMPCGGDASKICGGPSALSVYNNTGLLSPTSTSSIATSTVKVSSTISTSPTSTTRPNIKYLGCANEGATGRALSKDNYASNSMTPESCQDYCTGKGWQLSGTEYSTECWCGSVLENGATIGGSTACTMPCGGDASKICGGPNALSVYNNTGLLSPTSTSSIVTSTAKISSSTIKTSSTISTSPTSTTRPTIKYLGCANEGATGRALSKDTYVSGTMTPESCQDYCTGKGYALSGTEYSTEVGLICQRLTLE